MLCTETPRATGTGTIHLSSHVRSELSSFRHRDVYALSHERDIHRLMKLTANCLLPMAVFCGGTLQSIGKVQNTPSGDNSTFSCDMGFLWAFVTQTKPSQVRIMQRQTMQVWWDTGNLEIHNPTRLAQIKDSAETFPDKCVEWNPSRPEA